MGIKVVRPVNFPGKSKIMAQSKYWKRDLSDSELHDGPLSKIQKAIIAGDLDEDLLYHLEETEKVKAWYGTQNVPSFTLNLLWGRLESITQPGFRDKRK